ncbi:VOC family protein [Streptomyces sp. NPDC026673]|uniref:VOC family protein n=1 Tax=Streptomyces sp. NPDC026673 TaxID=3155724 RepID=UPI00340CAEFB
MDYSLEVVMVPVTDVDRSLAFYTEQAGFSLDVDYAPSDGFRVVQLTPPGSACSVQIGVGLTDAVPGSLRNLHLVVGDVERARRELAERGVAVGEPRHKSPTDDWQGGFRPGTDPERRDYASFFDFADPDDNTWVVQERGFRPVM